MKIIIENADSNDFNELANLARAGKIHTFCMTDEEEWIPVSERLPETANFGCFVTVYNTDIRTGEEFEMVLPYAVGYDGETWNDIDGEVIPFEVIAWRPLPEPYKRGNENG